MGGFSDNYIKDLKINHYNFEESHKKLQSDFLLSLNNIERLKKDKESLEREVKISNDKLLCYRNKNNNKKNVGTVLPKIKNSD